MKRHAPFSRRGEQAIQANQEAALAEAMSKNDVGDDIVHAGYARLARARAEQYLEPIEPVAVSAGEAVTWEHKADEIYPGAHARIVDTLEHPNTISVGASIDRMSAALGVGVLEPAVDAANRPRRQTQSRRCSVTRWPARISRPCACSPRARLTGTRPAKRRA